MTDHKALAEAIERDRANGAPGPWDVDPHGYNDCFGDVWLRDEKRVAENIDAPDAARIARLPDLEAAYLELWARVQELEGAIATHGAEACGILRAYHEEDGRRLWMALRAALQPPETTNDHD